jgi:hypothetical protein
VRRVGHEVHGIDCPPMPGQGGIGLTRLLRPAIPPAARRRDRRAACARR